MPRASVQVASVVTLHARTPAAQQAPVSGVGTPGGKLTVYLTEDSEDVRRDVSGVVEREAPGVDVAYVVTAYEPDPTEWDAELRLRRTV